MKAAIPISPIVNNTLLGNIDTSKGKISIDLKKITANKPGEEEKLVQDNVEVVFFSKVLQINNNNENTKRVVFDFNKGTEPGQIIYAKFLLNDNKIGYCAFDCWKLEDLSHKSVVYPVSQSSSSELKLFDLEVHLDIKTFYEGQEDFKIFSTEKASTIEKDYLILDGRVFVLNKDTGKYQRDRTVTVQSPKKGNSLSPVHKGDQYQEFNQKFDVILKNSFMPTNDKKTKNNDDVENEDPNLCVKELLGDKDLDIFHASFDEDSPKNKNSKKCRINSARYRVKVDGFKKFKPTGKKKALLIGCNYTGTKNELAGAIDDQKKIAKILNAAFGFDKKDIMMLNDTSRTVPDKEGILAAIGWLTNNAVPGDCLWFSFSGHGLQIRDKDGDEEDGFDEALMPLNCDSTRSAITDDEIFSSLVQDLKEGVKLTCFFDCCHSGSACDLGWTYDVDSDTWREEKSAVHTSADVVLVSGCMDSQQSQDVTLGRGAKQLKGGALTLSFCSELINNWGKHSYVSLVKQMKKSIHANGFTNQSPHISSTQAFDIGRPFNITDEICPNLNKILGPSVEKKRRMRELKTNKRKKKSQGRKSNLELTITGRDN